MLISPHWKIYKLSTHVTIEGNSDIPVQVNIHRITKGFVIGRTGDAKPTLLFELIVERCWLNRMFRKSFFPINRIYYRRTLNLIHIDIHLLTFNSTLRPVKLIDWNLEACGRQQEDGEVVKRFEYDRYKSENQKISYQNIQFP